MVVVPSTAYLVSHVVVMVVSNASHMTQVDSPHSEAFWRFFSFSSSDFCNSGDDWMMLDLSSIQ